MFEFATKNKSKSYLIILFISGFLSVGLFFYFKAIATPAGFLSPEELKVYLSQITDVRGGEIPAYGDIRAGPERSVLLDFRFA